METQSIAKNLVYQRKLKGYTQEELSEKTQVTIRTIQRIEKGDVSPHLQTVKLLATALNIDVEDLLVLENPKEETLLKKWLILLHGTPFIGFIIPLANILFPLFLWIHKRDDNKIYNNHGIKIINFQITMSILYLFSIVALLTIEKWGFLLFISVIPFSTVIMLFNIIKSFNSQKCYYPLSIPFISNKKRNISAKMMAVMLTGMMCFASCSDRNNKNIIRLDGTKISKGSLTKEINLLMENAHVTGLAISIFNDNDVVYQKAFGYENGNTKDTLSTNSIFYGASLSKAVFSHIVMQLVEEGKIDLDTPLQNYIEKPLPEYKFNRNWRGYGDLKGDKRYKNITARMCLSHTTGFPNWRFLTKSGFNIDGKLYFLFDPGTRYSYSGEGFSLLQFVVEKITGKGLEETAQELLFQPLGMDETSYIYVLHEGFENWYAYGHDKDENVVPFDEADEAGAAGSMGTTLVNYSKFIEAVLKQKILSKEQFDEMFTQQIKIDSKQQFGPNAWVKTDENKGINLGYGLGWGLLESSYGFGTFKEGGSEGFQHYSIIFPEKEIGIVILSNSDNAKGILKELLEISIGDIYTPWKWENYIPYNYE